MAEPTTILTATDETHNDCPVLTKSRLITATKGVAATVRWEMRNKNGEVLDLCSIMPDCCLDLNPAEDSSSFSENSYDQARVVFRFTEALWMDPLICEVEGHCYRADLGLVDVVLPADVYDCPGIYNLEVGLYDSNGDLVATDKGYISVERGLFGTQSADIGPVTFGEIRLQLRDTMFENDLLDDVEFDDAEVILSIVRPVREWNEKPPRVSIHTTRNFPYHDHWLRAIIANLLKIAGMWYERNRLQAEHGGIQVDDRNKLNTYLGVAGQLNQEWQDFMITQKAQINAALAWGSVGSPYG